MSRCSIIWCRLSLEINSKSYYGDLLHSAVARSDLEKGNKCLLRKTTGFLVWITPKLPKAKDSVDGKTTSEFFLVKDIHRT